MIVAVETVGSGDNPHAVEPELRVERKKEVIVPRQPREVVDQHRLELVTARGDQERVEAWTILEDAGLRLVFEDVNRVDRVAAGDSEVLAGTHLIVDALGALVVRRVAGIYRGLHFVSSRFGSIRRLSARSATYSWARRRPR